MEPSIKIKESHCCNISLYTNLKNIWSPCFSLFGRQDKGWLAPVNSSSLHNGTPAVSAPSCAEFSVHHCYMFPHFHTCGSTVWSLGGSSVQLKQGFQAFSLLFPGFPLKHRETNQMVTFHRICSEVYTVLGGVSTMWKCVFTVGLFIGVTELYKEVLRRCLHLYSHSLPVPPPITECSLWVQPSKPQVTGTRWRPCSTNLSVFLYFTLTYCCDWHTVVTYELHVFPFTMPLQYAKFVFSF